MYNFILVSGVQTHDFIYTHIYLTRWSPWQMYTNNIHSYHVTIDCVLYAALHIPWPFWNLSMYFFISSPFPPLPWAPPIWEPSVCSMYLWVLFCSACSFILFFKIPHISGIIWHLSFSVWLLSLTQYSVSADGKIHFSFVDESYAIVHMYHFFIHPSVDGHLSPLYILAIVKNAAANIWRYMSFCFSVWVSSEKHPELELLGPSLSPIIAFVLKYISSGITIATPAFLLLFLFSQNIFFHPLLSMGMSFNLMWFSCRQRM